MNIAFFLLPKSETVYLKEIYTVRQALEKMQHNGYNALPILNEAGMYIGTITASDFLWFFKDEYDLQLNLASKISLMDVPRKYDNRAVSIDSCVENLLEAAMEQNFIPVIDDLGVFIGIVRRREIIEYYKKSLSHK
ncbi:MAG: CBS domain-containing protein [Clostridiales bacterium]